MMPEVGMEVEAANNGGGALEVSGAARPAAVSLLRYSPALVAFIIAVTDVGRWADPDLWGHIRFGQLVAHARTCAGAKSLVLQRARISLARS